MITKKKTSVDLEKLFTLYKSLIERIDVSRFPMEMEIGIEEEEGALKVVLLDAINRETGKPCLIPFMRRLLTTEDEQEALDYIYWTTQEAILHELGECFRLDNKVVFDPHDVPEGKLGMIIGIPNKSWIGKALKIK